MEEIIVKNKPYLSRKGLKDYIKGKVWEKYKDFVLEKNRDKFLNSYIYSWYFPVHQIIYIHSIHRARGSRYEYSDIPRTILHFFTRCRIWKDNKSTEVRYRNIIDDLIEWGVIICDEWYVKGKKCKSYRLTEEWLEKEACYFTCTDEYINSRWQLFFTNKRDEGKLGEKSELTKIAELTIKDLEVSFNDIKGQAVKIKEEQLLLAQNLNKREQKLAKKLINDKYNSVLYTFENREDFNAVVRDAKTNRMHHVLSNTPSDYRKFFTYKGKSLYTIDLANSQPLLLATYLKDHYHKYVPIDVKKYIKDVEEGVLYEQVMKKLKIPLKYRSAFKQTFFGKIFYNKSTEGQGYDYEEETAFKELYPNVFNFIQKMKVYNYKNFPIALQKRESEIFVDNIFKELVDEKIFCLTLHDSIIFSDKKYAKKIEKKIKNYFKENFSLNVTTKFEDFGKEKARKNIIEMVYDRFVIFNPNRSRHRKVTIVDTYTKEREVLTQKEYIDWMSIYGLD